MHTVIPPEAVGQAHKWCETNRLYLHMQTGKNERNCSDFFDYSGQSGCRGNTHINVVPRGGPTTVS